MEPKEKLPLSKSDKLAEVDMELEAAMERLTETSERIERTIMNVDDEPDAEEVPQEDVDEAPGVESADGEMEK